MVSTLLLGFNSHESPSVTLEVSQPMLCSSTYSSPEQDQKRYVHRELAFPAITTSRWGRVPNSSRAQRHPVPYQCPIPCRPHHCLHQIDVVSWSCIVASATPSPAAVTTRCGFQPGAPASTQSSAPRPCLHRQPAPPHLQPRASTTAPPVGVGGRHTTTRPEQAANRDPS
jgi:hypothetical protein